MKAVILAGGYGTRISEESELRPKPMVEIGGRPLLWHIMKLYSSYGIREFIVCLGYMQHVVKDYFINYPLRNADLFIDIGLGSCETSQAPVDDWKIHLVDTGMDTLTGGRLKRVAHLVGDEHFCFTYGDGLSDVDISRLVRFHYEQNSIATVTAIQPHGKFGALEIQGTKVVNFKEKPKGDGSWVNGGFFVLSSEVFNYIHGDKTIWEEGPLEQLALAGQLSVWRHEGFWQCMDTLRDKRKLEELWATTAPWKVW